VRALRLCRACATVPCRCGIAALPLELALRLSLAQRRGLLVLVGPELGTCEQLPREAANDT